MIAQVDAVEDAPGEPPGALLEHGQAVGPLCPRDARELVGVVAGDAAEVLGEPAVGPRDEMHAQVLGVLGDAGGAVGTRQAHEEPRRVDARLGREPDEAPGRPVCGRGGDDEHRPVEALGEPVERRGIGHGGVIPVLARPQQPAGPARDGGPLFSLRADA